MTFDPKGGSVSSKRLAMLPAPPVSVQREGASFHNFRPRAFAHKNRSPIFRKSPRSLSSPDKPHLSSEAARIYRILRMLSSDFYGSYRRGKGLYHAEIIRGNGVQQIGREKRCS